MVEAETIMPVSKKASVEGLAYNNLSEAQALKVLETLYVTRLSDEKQHKLSMQNKGGTFYLSGAGHELVGAVCGACLIPGKDWTLPYYRDQALPVSLGCDLKDLFGVFLGRDVMHHSSGRMMPYHYSHKPLRILSQSSPVGSQFLHAVGIAYSIKLAQLDEVVYVSCGDGATSQGDFHEALNFASLYSLPVIFVVQDNEWAISVHKSEQTAAGSILPLAQSYPRVYAEEFNGKDYVGIASTMSHAVKRARNQEGPAVLIAKVPRLKGHSNSDDPKKYQKASELDDLHSEDPITCYEDFLLEEKLATRKELEQIHKKAFELVEKAALEAESLPFPKPETANNNLFQENCQIITQCQNNSKSSSNESQEIVIMDALNHALREEMDRTSKVVVFGQDVAHGKGGVFGITRGLTEAFGKERCFNTPLAESTILGIALGISATERHTAVAEIQFADYVWTGMNQLINEIATFSWRSNGQWSCPMVIRMPYGGYIQGGIYHSQSLEGYLTHCPGLKIVVPSNAADAKGLLKMAIRDPNPVVFLEHKAIYRQKAYCARNEPDKDFLLPIGKANCVRKGSDITLISWGFLLMKAYQVAQKLEKEQGISVEVIDLRTLIPLDMETILASIEKTGKAVILHEECITSGFGAEIASRIMEEAFTFLDAPVKRVGGLDIPVGYSKVLENTALPQQSDIEQAILDLYDF